jgi:hypothetical protein
MVEKKKSGVVDEKKTVTTPENTARAQYSELPTHRIVQRENKLFPYKIQTQESITHECHILRSTLTLLKAIRQFQNCRNGALFRFVVLDQL